MLFRLTLRHERLGDGAPPFSAHIAAGGSGLVLRQVGARVEIVALDPARAGPGTLDVALRMSDQETLALTDWDGLTPPLTLAFPDDRDDLILTAATGEENANRARPDLNTIRLSLPAAAPAAPRDISLTFKVIRTYWVYYLVTANGDIGACTIRDADQAFAFDEAPPATLADGTAVRVFWSRTSLPLLRVVAHQPALIEQTALGDRILIPTLPTPGVQVARMTAPWGKPELVSPIYVTL